MMKRAVAGLSALAASFILAACGSATVDSDSEVSPDATVAPLERGDNADSAEDSDEDSANSSSSAAPSTSKERASEEAGASESEASASKAEPAPKDRGAQEVEQAPTPQLADADAGYLDDIAAGGVDVNGVEDQLVGAGNTVCNPDDMVTVNAVAGQLIEQGRTDMSVEEVAGLINEKAQAAYC